MRYLRVHWLIITIITALLSCEGKDIGPPGSWGSDDTNTVVNVALILNVTDVDICNSAAAGATAGFTVEKINADLPDNTLYLEKYEVQFTASTDGSPTIESATVFITQTLPAEGIALLFIDENRKAKFKRDLVSYSPEDEFPRYIVNYTFYGKDKFGKEFGLRSQGTFSLGKYGDCSPKVEPSVVSLTGLSNPDNDASDDIVFHIEGGTEPYTIYSDNAAVINAPQANADGTFTIDPEDVSITNTVTLTVTDALGETATATVTVTPLPTSQATALSVSPSSVSLTGIGAPESDNSDNVTFYIRGGTEPFAIYSDNAAVINAPQANADGTFTIDPDDVSITNTVTLTVVDSVGSTTTATVTVTPLPASPALALSVSPSSVSLTGIGAPESDDSDNVTFYIRGGTAPYTVYSDATATIASPAVNTDGSFSIEPEVVAATKVVTLSVVDAQGASVTATVTVKAP